MVYYSKFYSLQVVKSDEENVFAFTLTLPDHSSLELHVDDAQDAEKWVHDLKFTASIYRKRRKPEHLPVSLLLYRPNVCNDGLYNNILYYC